ncbi:ABC transporter permease [Saccharothrix algeriensis]|uniref:ABC transporter permease n=1 Tax=Saccharothrix algeriensis TaxID=173560 RepID=A0A8T8HVU9_9PSEU|nr:ABC transporter permease [Saccharothrix algeriensis]MBM7814348.1 peptide/nickel transport system permease protein [Saccharothrix algeriensis]QTR02678.1 ABC transporter permease [Saccharothrix algeriensis]
MTRYLLRRAPSALVVLWLASVLVFLLIRAIPGDAAAVLAGADAPPGAVAAIRADLGLDRPVVEQYLRWAGDLLTGEFGRSYLIGGDIGELVADGLGNTAALALSALLLAVLTALLLGPLWAATRNRWVDRLLTAFHTASVALPTFVTGVLLILVFGVLLRLLPTGGVPPGGLLDRVDITAQYLVLPAACLALPVAGVLTGFLAEALRGELRQDYVTTALAAGVRRRDVVVRHALRGALPVAVTTLGLQTGTLLGGAVLVESIFAWPGLGLLVEQGITRRDYPVVQVLLLLSVAVFVVVQLLTDVAHALLDPRVRLGGGR